MTKLFASVAVFALTTSATFAGGYVAPVASAPPPKTASVAAYDWSGAYGGLSYGTQRTRASRDTQLGWPFTRPSIWTVATPQGDPQ